MGERPVQTALLLTLLLVLLALGFGAWRLALEAERVEQTSELHTRLGVVQRELEARTGRYLSLLRASSASLEYIGPPDANAWEQFVRRLNLEFNYPQVDSLNLLRHLSPDEVHDFETEIQAQLDSDFAVISDSGRDFLCVITYSSAPGGGQPGYDACQAGTPRDALLQAASLEEPVLSAPLQFSPAGNETEFPEERLIPGMIFVSPLFMEGRGPDQALFGWLAITLSTESLFAGLEERLDSYHLTVNDRGVDDGPTPIFDNRADQNLEGGVSVIGTLEAGNRQWELQLSRSFHPGPFPYAVLVASWLVSVLLVFLVRNGYQTRYRAEELAEQMTRAWGESEAQRKRTEELSLIMVTHVDIDGRWSRATPRLGSLLGVDEKEMVGRPVLEFVHPDDQWNLENELQSLIAGTVQSAWLEARLQSRTGETIWSEFNVSLVRNDEGEPQYFLAFIQDVSDRKAWEVELGQRDRLLGAIAESLSHLIAPRQFDAAVEEMLSLLGRAAGVDRAYIFVNHPHPQTGLPAHSMRYEWVAGGVTPEIDNPDMQNLLYSLLPEEWYDSLNQGRPVRAMPRNLGESAREILESQDIKSLLLVPIMLRDGFMGHIGFDDCHQERSWPESQVSALMAAAASLGNAFERQETEEALDHNRRLLVSITDNISEGIYRSTPEGELEYVNSALAEMFGYDSPEEMMQVPAPIHYCSRERREELQEHLKEYGHYRDEEVDFMRRDGSRFVALNNAVALKGDSGRIIYLDGVISDITERKEAERKINYLAHYDTLTGLPNRTMLRDRMHQALAKAKRHGYLAGILFIDLDRFKNVNDSLGHAVGDRLLSEVSRRLQSETRAEDTVSRQGGDEFIVLLPEIGEANEAAQVATKLLSALGEPYRIGNHELHVTPSIGISIYPDDAEEIDELIRNADAAMYQAKERGRFNFQFFTHDLSVQAWERLSLENQLRRAIQRQEFVLYYQPQLSLETGEIIGVEALVRWRHEGRLISPNVFIPVAEQTGMIIEIGDWVLTRACQQIQEWQEEGLPLIPVSVNLSPMQFRRRDIRNHIQQALAGSGVSPEYLVLELTEGTVMEEVEESVRMLSQLSRLGVGLCIDDFGTGYSSLSYLKRFPIDKLKIDKSFVSDIPDDPDDMAITAAVIDMGHNLNLRIVAEGVETREQLQFLRQRGCQEMQGFLFSRPVPADEMAEMLKHRSRLDVAS